MQVGAYEVRRWRTGPRRLRARGRRLRPAGRRRRRVQGAGDDARDGDPVQGRRRDLQLRHRRDRGGERLPLLRPRRPRPAPRGAGRHRRLPRRAGSARAPWPRLPAQQLQGAFALLLLFIGARMVWDALAEPLREPRRLASPSGSATVAGVVLCAAAAVGHALGHARGRPPREARRPRPLRDASAAARRGDGRLPARAAPPARARPRRTVLRRAPRDRDPGGVSLSDQPLRRAPAVRTPCATGSAPGVPPHALSGGTCFGATDSLLSLL